MFKKLQNSENNKNIYKSKNVSISIEDNIYIFDIDSILYTNDVLEAVSYLIRHDEYHNEKFWDIEITETMIDFVLTSNSLYWLSGGETFWNNWKYCWSETHEHYENKFKNKLYNLLEDVKTMNDLKNKLKKEMNLDIFFEFALLLKLKKEKI